MRLQKLKKFNYERGRQGIAIYFAVAALSIVLAIALGAGLLVNRRLKMLNQAGDAVIAFSAAQTGIEWSLFSEVDEGYDSGDVDLGNGAIYRVTAYSCDVDTLCVKSTGQYRGASRAVKIKM